MNVSYSLMRTIEACPYQYYLRSKSAAKRPDDRNFLVGAVCDDLLRDWYFFQCEPGWMQKRIDEYFEKYESKHSITWRRLTKESMAKEGVSSDRMLLYKRVRKTIPSIESTIIAHSLNRPNEVMAQRDLKVPFPTLEQHHLVGRPDLWDSKNRILFEMKVTQDIKYLDPDQLTFYAMMTLLIDKQDIKGMFFLAPQKREKLIPVAYDRQNVKMLAARCKALVSLINAGKFEPIGRCNTCFSCDYRLSVCPTWQLGAPPEYTIEKGLKRVSF